jgi:hypothetical protein
MYVCICADMYVIYVCIYNECIVCLFKMFIKLNSTVQLYNVNAYGKLNYRWLIRCYHPIYVGNA